MSQQFPLVYRMGRSWRIFCGLLGGTLSAASVAAAAYCASHYDQGDISIPVFFGLCVFPALLGVPCIGSALRYRVLVHADAIEALVALHSILGNPGLPGSND